MFFKNAGDITNFRFGHRYQNLMNFYNYATGFTVKTKKIIYGLLMSLNFFM